MSKPAAAALAAMLLSATTWAGAAEPHRSEELRILIGDCLELSRTSIGEVLSLELNRAVTIDVPPATPALHAGADVVVDCRPGALTLTYKEGHHRRERDLDVSQVSDKAVARTVALAIVALVEAPERNPGQVASTPSHEPQMRPALPHVPLRKTASSVGLLGTSRFFPSSSDQSLGLGLRSRLLALPKSAVLLGVGAERGSAERDAGTVRITAMSGELGITRDLWSAGKLTLGLELVSQAGYVALRGEPRSPELTVGQQVTGVWAAVLLALAPRVRLGDGFDLTLQAGGGAMLVGPAASSDARELEVWRGANLTASLGLSVLL